MLLVKMFETKHCMVFTAWDDKVGYHYMMQHPGGTQIFTRLEDAEKRVEEVETQIVGEQPDPFSQKGELFNAGREMEA